MDVGGGWPTRARKRQPHASNPHKGEKLSPHARGGSPSDLVTYLRSRWLKARTPWFSTPRMAPPAWLKWSGVVSAWSGMGVRPSVPQCPPHGWGVDELTAPEHRLGALLEQAGQLRRLGNVAGNDQLVVVVGLCVLRKGRGTRRRLEQKRQRGRGARATTAPHPFPHHTTHLLVKRHIFSVACVVPIRVSWRGQACERTPYPPPGAVCGCCVPPASRNPAPAAPLPNNNAATLCTCSHGH